MIANPMRRPHAIATNYVWRLTPVGTHIDDVIEVIENRGDWRIHGISREGGFAHPRLRGPDHGWPESPTTGHAIVGEQSIRAHPEVYRAWYKLFIPTRVSIFWGFDADGYLLEIFVWKDSGP